VDFSKRRFQTFHGGLPIGASCRFGDLASRKEIRRIDTHAGIASIDGLREARARLEPRSNVPVEKKRRVKRIERDGKTHHGGRAEGMIRVWGHRFLERKGLR